MLKFITRTRPRIFTDVIYQVQISTLLDMGYLARVEYFRMDPAGWNELNLKVNTTGADYTDKSVAREYERIDFYGYLAHIVRRLMNPKSGVKRKGILVFTRFLKEAENLTRSVPGCAVVSGDTPKRERERVLADFKSGALKVVANVGVLTTGFDYPELDTVVMARPTMSLALWYQIVGRCVRPHPDKKSSWCVDLCGNIKRFGEVSDLTLKDAGGGKWAVYSKGRQLTNTYF
jgi:DNA repair protein RadD